MTDILALLSKDSSLTHGQIAAMLGMKTEDVAETIRTYEENRVILGYQAVIDWEKAGGDSVTALIDVKVTPQRGEGFDRVAERIYQFDEVESLFLMSGGYDLSVLITGRSMRDVALFVAQKLAPIEGVTSTATHFLLKKYKERGEIFVAPEEQQERMKLL